MRPQSVWIVAILGLLFAAPTLAQDEFPEADAILRALDAEMARSMTLQLEDLEKPYQIQYTVDDTVTHRMSASYGALISSDRNRGRTFRSQIRVGSYELDNTNFQGAGGGGFGGGRGGGGRGPAGRGAGGEGARLPIDDDISALRKAIWLASDRDYKNAVATLSQKRSFMKDQGIEDRPEDYTKVDPVRYFESRSEFTFDEPRWQERLRSISAKFLEYPHIVDSSVRLQAVDGRRYLITSEGSRIVTGDTQVILTIQAVAQAENGETIQDDRALLAQVPSELPDDRELLSMVEALAGGLARAIAAPSLEDYVGPVLFDGEAAPQLFEQLLAGGAAAQAQPVGAERRRRGGSQSLDRFMNRSILPASFQVYDDPRIETVGEEPLAGHYRFDDEGIEAQRVDLVVDGRVQDLLMSRTPAAKRSGTNGHARGAGAGVGCLFVESKEGLSDADMKQALIDAADAQGLEYALRVSSIAGGGARGAQVAIARFARGGGRRGGGGGGAGGGAGGSALGDPIFVYKVYVADGREEPVRGCQFDAIDIRDLERIAAAGGTPTVLNRFGGNATSIVAPAVLIEELELARVEAEQQPKPILEAPHVRKD